MATLGKTMADQHALLISLVGWINEKCQSTFDVVVTLPNTDPPVWLARANTARLTLKDAGTTRLMTDHRTSWRGVRAERLPDLSW